MICSKCNYNNIDTNKMCVNCGSPLTSNNNVTPPIMGINNTTPTEINDQISKINTRIKTNIISYIIGGVFLLIWSISFFKFCFSIYTNNNNNTSKSISILFLIIATTAFLFSINMFRSAINLIKLEKEKEKGNLEAIQKLEKEKEKNSEIGLSIQKLFTGAFFIFWFGFLIIFDSFAIEQLNSGGFILLLFSLIFWVVGIMGVKNNLFGKKK